MKKWGFAKVQMKIESVAENTLGESSSHMAALGRGHVRAAHAARCTQALRISNHLSSEVQKNLLLAALPLAELQRWLPLFEVVDLPLGLVLCEAGDLPTHAYFPTTAIVSLLYVMEDGASAETAMVGNDGMVGVTLFMGGQPAASRAVVRGAGVALRLSAEALNIAFNGSRTVMQLLLRYSQALITQMAQTAVCNRHHTLDKQLCRWLLLSLDRLPGNELAMTQELIANLLGVRREGVTDAATKLQHAGLISYSRGHITILNRPGLEQCSCECYGVVKNEFDRLLTPTSTA